MGWDEKENLFFVQSVAYVYWRNFEVIDCEFEQ
jgi:hypothetical protein